MTGEQWLTYQQTAELFGMSAEAVRQRARRLGWRTQRANDGKTLVQVPPDVIVQPRVRPPVETPVQTPVQTNVQNPEIEALSALVDTLRAELAKVEAELAEERRQRQAGLVDVAAATATIAAQMAEIQRQHELLQNTLAQIERLTEGQKQTATELAMAQAGMQTEKHVVNRLEVELAEVRKQIQADKMRHSDELHLAETKHRLDADGLREEINRLNSDLSDYRARAWWPSALGGSEGLNWRGNIVLVLLVMLACIGLSWIVLFLTAWR